MHLFRKVVLLLIIKGLSISIFAQTETETLGVDAVTDADYSVFIGNSAGKPYFNNSGYNTIIGHDAGVNGSSTAIRNSNVLIGQQAGANLNPYSSYITGNVLLGASAGKDSKISQLNTIIGYQSGYSVASLDSYNLLWGYWSGRGANIKSHNIILGYYNCSSSNINIYNTILGFKACYNSMVGSYNILNGHESGMGSLIGSYNLFNGYGSGKNANIGERNICNGYESGSYAEGYNSSSLNNSVFIGWQAGYFTQTTNSIFIGQGTGYNSSGENNLYLGNGAGSGSTLSNKLVIHNDVGGIDAPLIEGDFANQFFNINGKIGVNIAIPEHELDVNGTVRAQELVVEVLSSNTMNLEGELFADKVTVRANGNTADFVFEENYELKDLSEVEAFIKENKHLPEIPSAEEMEEQGVNLAEMNKLLLQKVEELTLYTIIQAEQIKNKDKELEVQKIKVNNLENRMMEVERVLSKQ